MSNVLLETSDLPKFSEVKPELIVPAVEQRIRECKETIRKIIRQDKFTWNNLVEPMEKQEELLSKTWSPVSHMHSVVDSPELRKAYEACLPLLSEYATYVGQHQNLYQAFAQLKDSDEFTKLNQAQKTYILHTLRDFKLSGVALNNEDKKHYGEITKRLSELSNQFSNNVLDATQAWTKHITDSQYLSGLPESAFTAAEEKAKRKKKDGWLLTLDVPTYQAVITYADHENIRKEMYTAFVTRASDQGPHAGEFDNTVIIDEILSLRYELAKLLNFENYAMKSLATKMAESGEQVLTFLTQLAEKSKPQAEHELEELKLFALQHNQKETLEAWDYAYYSEKMKQYQYELSQEELRPYFPENRVLEGMFSTMNKLFNISIKERKDVDVWHKHVRFFDVFDEFDDLKGSFYLDLYTREGKQGGAWMDVCQDRMLKSDELQHPVAYLTCNFSGPVSKKPALFTHDEVVTLFHEFGHTLHHILTEINVVGVSGINGVAWDAVELPSQFLENWCYQPEVLSEISAHYETGESLPDEMLDKILKSKNYQSGMAMLRQLEFSLFDFGLHLNYRPDQTNIVQQQLDEVRRSVAVIHPPSFHRFQHSFSHVFSGGYAAGYYSYKWAEVLSADAFARFEEEGIFNKETGQHFLQHILQKGGSLPAMALFRSFRGREPSINALLRHCGIGQNQNASTA